MNTTTDPERHWPGSCFSPSITGLAGASAVVFGDAQQKIGGKVFRTSYISIRGKTRRSGARGVSVLLTTCGTSLTFNEGSRHGNRPSSGKRMPAPPPASTGWRRCPAGRDKRRRNRGRLRPSSNPDAAGGSPVVSRLAAFRIPRWCALVVAKRRQLIPGCDPERTCPWRLRRAKRGKIDGAERSFTRRRREPPARDVRRHTTLAFGDRSCATLPPIAGHSFPGSRHGSVTGGASLSRVAAVTGLGAVDRSM